MNVSDLLTSNVEFFSGLNESFADERHELSDELVVSAISETQIH